MSKIKNRAKRFKQQDREVQQKAKIQSYAQYIDSPEWKATKKAKMRAEPKVCAACGDLRQIHCHHMCYRIPFNRVKLSDLLWLCQGCHALYHSRVTKPLSFRMSQWSLIQKTLAIIAGTETEKAPRVVSS